MLVLCTAAIIQREESCPGAITEFVERTMTARLTLFWFILIFCHFLLCCHLLFIKVAVHFPGEWLHFMTPDKLRLCKLSSWTNNFRKDEKRSDECWHEIEVFGLTSKHKTLFGSVCFSARNRLQRSKTWEYTSWFKRSHCAHGFWP